MPRFRLTLRILFSALSAWAAVFPAVLAAQEDGEKRTVTVESAYTVESENVPDELTGSEKTVTVFRGGAVISVSDGDGIFRISADEIIYDRAREMLEARGNVRYERGGAVSGEEGESGEIFRGGAMLFNIAKMQGVFLDGVFTRDSGQEDADPFIVRAEAAGRDSGSTIAFRNGVLTSCDAEEPHWTLRASRIWMLPGNELALLNGILFIGPLPVFYVPFFYYPGDEMVFHPVFGYRNREGFFVQTTTYLYGQKPPPDPGSEESGSLSNFLDSGAAYRQERDGLFLRNTAERLTDPDPDYFKLKLDAYSGLGVLAGIDGSFTPDARWLDSVSIAADAGFSRTLYPLNSAGFYSPYAQDGTRRKDYGWMGGMRLPFRYRGNFALTSDDPVFSLRLSMPFVSDPYFKQDFTDRSETLNWVDFLMNQSELAQGDDDITTETSFDWRLYGSFTPDVSFLSPWITSLSVSSFSAEVSFSSMRNRALSGEDLTYAPERSFFYPEYFRPAVSFRAAGTLLSSETPAARSSLQEKAAPDLQRLSNPFLPPDPTAGVTEPENGPDTGNGTAAESGTGGIAAEQESAGEPGAGALPEILALLLAEAEDDPEFTVEELAEQYREGETPEIADLLRLRAAEEELAARDLAVLQSAGVTLTGTERALLAASGIELTGEEEAEIAAVLEAAEEELAAAVVTRAPSAGTTPAERFLPALPAGRAGELAMSSGSGVGRYSLTWDFTPSFAYESNFDVTAWTEPGDVSFRDFSSLFYRIQTPLRLLGDYSWSRDTVHFSSGLNFYNTVEDHFYLSDRVYASEASRNSVLLSDWRNSVFSLQTDNELRVRPFARSEMLYPVEIGWNFTGDILHKEFTGTAADPAWEVRWMQWDDAFVDEHSLSAVIGLDVAGYEEKLTVSSDLSPLLRSYGAGLELSWFFGSFAANGAYQEEENAAGGLEWLWDPLTANVSWYLPLGFTFSQEYTHDMNEEEPSTLSVRLAHSKFSAYYTVNNAIQYTLKEGQGWVAEGAEPQFKPYACGISWSNIAQPFRLQFWKNRITVQAGFNAGLEFNLVRQTESNFNFTPEITVQIHDVFDLTFRSTSTNSVLARYFQKWMGLPVEIPGERNILVDLAKSFNFWDAQDRRESGFKLKTLEMEMNHYLHDWTATFKAVITPELRTEGGRPRYEFSPELAFSVSWNPVSDVRATAKSEDGRFTLSAAGTDD